jgi:hypothetical protein
MTKSRTMSSLNGKDQCKKLQRCIMNIDGAKNVNELLELTIAR